MTEVLPYGELPDIEAYLHDQEQEVRSLEDDEVGEFVLASLQTLATDYFNPLVREVGAAVPLTEDDWLLEELRDANHKTWVDPSLTELLPARATNEATYNTSSSCHLMLKMDNAPIKIRTWARTSPADGQAMMAIASYSRASRAEVARYGASADESASPDSSLFLPVRTVHYSNSEDAGVLCSTSNLRNPDEQFAMYMSDAKECSPDEFRLLHRAFMTETRVALGGLWSIGRSA